MWVACISGCCIFDLLHRHTLLLVVACSGFKVLGAAPSAAMSGSLFTQLCTVWHSAFGRRVVRSSTTLLVLNVGRMFHETPGKLCNVLHQVNGDESVWQCVIPIPYCAPHTLASCRSAWPLSSSAPSLLMPSAAAAA